MNRRDADSSIDHHTAAPNQRFPNASQDAVFPTETPKGDATGPAPGVAAEHPAAGACDDSLAGETTREDKAAHLQALEDDYERLRVALMRIKNGSLGNFPAALIAKDALEGKR